MDYNIVNASMHLLKDVYQKPYLSKKMNNVLFVVISYSLYCTIILSAIKTINYA